MFTMTLKSVGSFPSFLSYLLTAFGLVALFAAIYIRITPHKEISLIREGNTAAAIGLVGALLGYSIAVAASIPHSVNLLDMVIWGMIAVGVQLAVVIISRQVLPKEFLDISNGKYAPAVLVGGLSVCAGILNAACMTY